jgi:uncharacterized protein (DUF983 family)
MKAGVLRRCAKCGELFETYFEVQPEVFICKDCEEKEEEEKND